jgi:transketolase
MKGYFSRKELLRLRKIDGILEGHPSIKINGVDVSSGSLGQGLSIANGMALAKKLDNKQGYVYCLMGDGEIEEGQVWEACMTASQYKLDNLIAFVDYNGLQIDGSLSEVTTPEPIKEKFEAFGFNVYQIDGHDMDIIIQTIMDIKNNPNEKPSVVILETIKGKGISFMENNFKYHGKKLTEEEYIKAKEELK